MSDCMIVRRGGGGGEAIKLRSETVTPSASPQTVLPGDGFDGLSFVTVYGDSDLVSENIKDGVTIFNVTGNYTGESSEGDADDYSPSTHNLLLVYADTQATWVSVSVPSTGYFKRSTDFFSDSRGRRFPFFIPADMCGNAQIKVSSLPTTTYYVELPESPGYFIQA